MSVSAGSSSPRRFVATAPKVRAVPDAAPPKVVETRAELVPGSTFRGRGGDSRTHIDPKSTLQTLEKVLHGRSDVTAVERVEIKGPDGQQRATQTVVVTIPGSGQREARRLTIRIDVGPLEGETVARSWVNSTQQGVSDTSSGPHRILGRHVIQISNEIDAAHAERAVAHEVAEIFAIDRLNFSGSYGAPDALRPGAHGTVLSPHDLGRLAELDVVVRSTDARAGQELHALIEHLGLREGTAGSDARLALATQHVSAHTAEVIRAARHEPSPGSPEHARLAELRTHARADEAAERARTTPDPHDMPSLRGPDGAPLTGAALEARAKTAAKTRAARSEQTWKQLAELQAHHKGDGFPALPYPVMLGGGASLAARDRGHLLIDDRGRWQADGNDAIAQTANQLKHAADAKLGDPRLHVAPNERLPIDAVRAWEDEIAAQGPVIDGRGNLQFGTKGEMLIDILSHGTKLTFRLDSVPLVTTGFVPERIPGAPFGVRPGDAVQNLATALEKAAANPLFDGEVHVAAQRALELLKKTPIVGNHEARRLLDVLHDPKLRAAMANNDAVKQALQLGDAVAAWETMIAADDPAHPHVFFGDQANVGRDQALRSNNWVIAGTGGTGVSAAELFLHHNPKAHITMVGPGSPAGLLENDQFRMLAEAHADAPLAKIMGITKQTSGRLSIITDYVGHPIRRDRTEWEGGHRGDLADESTIDPALRSKAVYDVNGTTSHATGTAYVASIGRNNDYPPVVMQLIEQARIQGGKYFILPLFHDRQYVGYRVRITGLGDDRFIDVSGAASRFLPIADAKNHFDHEAAGALNMDDELLDAVAAASDWDAPAESGNFAGGFAPTATQASRYAKRRADSKTKEPK